jgi:hypothetical protein
MSSSSLLVSRILLYLARLRLPRFQRLILLFEISWALQRLSAQLSQAVIFYAFGAGPSGQKSDDVMQPEMSKLQRPLGRIFGAKHTDLRLSCPFGAQTGGHIHNKTS